MKRKLKDVPVCSKCGENPCAIDQGDGRVLEWCKDCIRRFVRERLPHPSLLTFPDDFDIHHILHGDWEIPEVA